MSDGNASVQSTPEQIWLQEQYAKEIKKQKTTEFIDRAKINGLPGFNAESFRQISAQPEFIEYVQQRGFTEENYTFAMADIATHIKLRENTKELEAMKSKKQEQVASNIPLPQGAAAVTPHQPVDDTFYADSFLEGEIRLDNLTEANKMALRSILV